MKEKKNFLIKLGDFITNFRYCFLIIFIGLFVFCLFNVNNVKVNDSIISYLPDDTETKYGLDLMEDEFGNFTSIQLMVSDISLEEANSLMQQLSNIKNISQVSFDGTEMSYKNEKALYQIQVKEVKDEQLDQVISDIKELVQDDKYNLYSDSLEDPTAGIDIVLLLAVVVIVIILLITSKTYFEPVIAFIIFGISIILNMGSNFLFGEISYITKSIAVILQLALSIDYIIIFMNQFMKEINDTDDKILAIKKTTSKAMPEIFASSLTTISGLMALIFMQLKIGGDIGIVLSKGIICSLLTVILVMPSLLSIFMNLIIKCKKKEKKKNLNQLSSFILKSRKILLPIFLILVIMSILIVPKYHYVYNNTESKSIRLSENIKSLNNIEEVFGKDNMLVILVKNSEKDYSKELELVNELKNNKSITSITSIGSYEIAENIYLGSQINYLEFSQLFNINSEMSLNLFQFYANDNNQLDQLMNINEYRISIIDLLYFLNEKGSSLPIPEEMKTTITEYYTLLNNNLSSLESSNYSRFIIHINKEVESEETYELMDDLRNITEKYYSDVTLVGNSINAIDLESSFTSDNLIITAITILFIAIILLFTFKSIGMTLLLILTIEGSILINFGIITLLGKNIFFMGYVVVSAIQMGATIDYAIVMASRYQGLRKKYDKKEALLKTLEDTLPAILTSGLILLIAGFLIGFISTSSVISAIGLFLGIGTLVSLIATIFVLPAILYVCDKFIKITTFKKEK